MRAIVLVEGVSDRVALETLAARRGRDLSAEGVAVVAIWGAQAIGRIVATLPTGVAPVGLCDVAEERHFRRVLGDAYDVCNADLEEELIRSLGAETVEAIVEANGDLRRLRTMQKQPEWRGRPLGDQLRRFMGSGGSRKIRYALLLV